MAENFFEFRERLSARAARVESPLNNADTVTVSQLTQQIDRALKSAFPQTIHVRGELSNCKLHRASGHFYFTLKDASACIDCIMFRSDAEKLKFTPEDGLEAVVSGKVGVYGQRGRYQLYATRLAPLGRGALELAFRQLHEKLERDGLFAAQRKRALPKYPRRIALVTSQSTAALQDMLKVLRRFSWLQLSVFHVPVQGEGAAARIAEAITLLNGAQRNRAQPELLILARGGGSLEDLWAFNEEVVARAVFASRIPVVTGIGHEIDTSIADLVADYHAHTPTEAVQVVSAAWRAVSELLAAAQARLARGAVRHVEQARQRWAAMARHEFFRRPTDRINQLRQVLDDRQLALNFAAAQRLRRSAAEISRLAALLAQQHPQHRVKLHLQHVDDIAARLTVGLTVRLQQSSQRLDLLGRHLQAVSPIAVLERGFTITTRKNDGAILRRQADLKPGDRIITRFADGQAESVVEDQAQLKLFE